MREDLESRPVIGYEGLYEVSNYGDVRSFYTNKLLSSGLSQGYHYVALTKRGLRLNKQVHRLVAEAFIPNPNNYPIINHKDEVKTNNYYKNLEWCTQQYNATYNDAHIKRGLNLRGRPAHNKGKTNYMSEEAKEKIRQSRLGTHLSEETKRKMRETNLRKKLDSSYVNKSQHILSDESREKNKVIIIE